MRLNALFFSVTTTYDNEDEDEVGQLNMYTTY